MSCSLNKKRGFMYYFYVNGDFLDNVYRSDRKKGFVYSYLLFSFCQN